MKHPDVVLRSFRQSDEEMLQQAEVKQASFKENKGRFTDRFPNLADPFATDWTLTITKAREMLPDYLSLATQAGETTTLEALMEQGRNLFQTLVLYAKIAFPKNTALLKLMGQSQYESARGSQLQLPSLLRTAYSVASKPEYKPGLIASGMKEADIALLDTLAKSIVDQDVTQEKSKIDRSLDSSVRILTMNAVYEKMALVCQCAKLVFQNDAALYNLFLLDDGTAASPTPEVPPAPPAN